MWKRESNVPCDGCMSGKNFVSLVAVVFVVALLQLAGCREEPARPTSDPGSHAGSISLISPTGEDDAGMDVNQDGILSLEFSVDRERVKPDTKAYRGEESGFAAASALTVIDFEMPNLGMSSSLVINPFIDPSTGVTFSAIGGVVGIVKNISTSACVDPPSEDQKLASGVGGVIGLSGFRIKATFPEELPAATTVSMEVQCVAGGLARLVLFDRNFAVVGLVREVIEPGNGTCGFPGPPRARKVVSATSTGPVKHAMVDLPNQGLVFVIDDFSFGTEALYTLDIRPGSCPNPFNPVSRGVLPVAIVASDGADVSEIDISTVRLEGVAPLRSNTEDVTAQSANGDCACITEGPDGYQDLTLKFATQDVAAAVGSLLASEVRTLTLTGSLLDGTDFEISDCIQVVGRGERNVVGDHRKNKDATNIP